jgi:hypothetical protein
MSLIDPLIRFFDPIAHREREAKRRDAREAGPRRRDPEGGGDPVPAPSWREPRRRCRICGEQADTRYCMLCLADTMEKVPSSADRGRRAQP